MTKTLSTRGAAFGAALTGALAACVLSTAASAHQDDPKETFQAPPYPGPGISDGVGGTPPFPMEGIQFLSWVTIPEFGPEFTGANDCWGYVSPTGNEYAIIGLSAGTGFVDITNPGSPHVLGVIPSTLNTWHDIKTFGHYAYKVTEASGGGIQVIDLDQIDEGAITLVNTVTTGGSTSTHNVALNEASGYLYRCGGSGLGLRVYDLNADPVNPPFVGQWNDRYVHDAQIVSYTEGPYAGMEVAFCCGGFNGGYVETGLDILDVTDKSNIQLLGRLVYPNGAYSHQGWLSSDRHYFFLGDELDENGVLPTTTFVIDVSDLANPTLATTFTNGNTSIGHNMYVVGDLLFEANYRSGLRVFDVSDPLDAQEIAYLDTQPSTDTDDFGGMWSNYPYFPSGTIIGSDRTMGLVMMRLDVAPPPSTGDLDGDGAVTFADLLMLLGDWGDCLDPPAECPADLDQNGVVGFADLLIMLANWG